MRLLARRFGVYVVAAWVALSITFFLPRLVPGSELATLIGRATRGGLCNAACIASLDKLVGSGVNTSIWVQYLQYWGHLFQGNLGISYFDGSQPVTTLIGNALPWTVGLLGVSTVLAFVLGTGLGVLLAWMRGSWLDWIIPGFTFFQAIPFFFLALVLVMVFTTLVHWFPSAGGSVTGTTGLAFWGSVLDHSFLPAVTIVLASMAGFLLGMRNQMVSVMDEDFVLVARAKGLPTRRVVWYAARNAILPSISNFALAISLVVAGQLLVEIVFSYPGIGYLLFQAVINKDLPLTQGIFLVITLVVLAANFIADIVYVLVDPRARQEA